MRHTGLLSGLTLAIALGGLGAAVEAQQQGGMGRGMQHGMPGGNPVDMAERFGEADADGDGKVSRDEIVARMTARAAERIEARADRMIARHDRDGDGMLTLEEMRSGPAGRMFGRLDADGDGAISREEFDRMRDMHRKRHGRDHGQRHGRGDGKHHGDGAGMGHHGKAHHGRRDHRTERRSMGQGGVVIHHHHYYYEK